MSTYFQKLSEYYNSDQADRDNKRFIRQLKNTYVSTAIIIGAVFFLIIIILIISAVSSVIS